MTWLSKYLMAALSLLLGLSTALSVAAQEKTPQTETHSKVRVTAILPLSGAASAVGEALRNGITLALEKLPPNLRSQLEISYEDDGFSSTKAVSAFYKNLNSTGVDVLINAGSGTGQALAPIAEQRKVTFISISSDASISRGKNYVFNFWVTPEEEAKVAIPEALKHGFKKIARITTQHDGTLAVKDAFDRENKGRIQIALDEEFPADGRDFKTYIAKLRLLKEVDAVMVLLLPGQCGVFAKQMQQAGLKQDLFAIEVFEDPSEVKASEGALIGRWYINAEEPDEAFIHEYTTRFPGASLWGALNTHDSIMLIAAAIQQGLKPSETNQFLHNLKDFKGALGTYSASGDNRFSLPATVKVVRENGFEKLYKSN